MEGKRVWSRRIAWVALVVAALGAAGLQRAGAASKWVGVPCSPDTSPAGLAANGQALVAALDNAQKQQETALLLAGRGCTYQLDAADTSGQTGATDGPNGLPIITSHVTICGNGSSGVPGSFITRSPSATGQFRLFEVASGGSLTLSCQVTLSNGRAADGVAGQAAGADGTPGDNGGAVLVDQGGSLSLDGATLTGNSAGDGGHGAQGATGASGTLQGGTGGNGGNGGAGGDGGAIFNDGTVNLVWATIDGNSAGSGGVKGSAGTGGKNALGLAAGGGNPGSAGAPGDGGGVFTACGANTVLSHQSHVSFTPANHPDDLASASGC